MGEEVVCEASEMSETRAMVITASVVLTSLFLILILLFSGGCGDVTCRGEHGSVQCGQELKGPLPTVTP